MNTTYQKICAWSGLVCVATYFIGFWAIAGFLPPPSPALGKEEVAQLFRDNTSSIRIGMIISMYAAALIAVWAAGMLVQLRRAEGRNAVFSYLQFGLGVLLAFEFIYLIMFWEVATFRTDRSPEITQTLNDMAWIPFTGLTSTGVIEFLVIGAAMLADRRQNPVFPRWAGYFNIWVGIMVTPGCVNVFFKSGPFTWGGLIALYLPLAAFTLSMIVNSALLLRAIKHQELEEVANASVPQTAVNGKVWDVEDLGRELRAVQSELARVAARV